MLYGLGKIQEILPILTTKQLSPKVHDKAYVTYGFSDMLHSSESWGLNMGYDFQRHNTMCIIS